MESDERRKLPRHSVKLDGMIITPGASIPMVATEISVGGIRVLAARSVSSGTNVAISLQIGDEILLYGTVIWALDSGANSSPPYQMGIETYAMVLPEIKAIAFPEKAELFEDILSRIKKIEQQND